MKFVTFIFFISCCFQLFINEQQYFGKAKTLNSDSQCSYNILSENQASVSEWVGFETEEEDQDFHLLVCYINKSADNIHFENKSIESAKAREAFALPLLTWLRTRSDLPPPCLA